MVIKLFFTFILIMFTRFGLFAQNQLFECSNIQTTDISAHGNTVYNHSSLYLTLTDDKEYSLVLSRSSFGLFDDVHSATQISYGTYYYTDTVLFLRDALFGFVIELNTDEAGMLVVRKGLNLVLGKTFVIRKDNGFPITHFSFDKKKKNSNILKLLNGRYMNCASGSYELIIYDNQLYEYCIDGFLISNGTWCQKDNLLSFKDNGLELPFYATLEENSIITGPLPGNNKPHSLLRVSDCYSNVYYGTYEIDINSNLVNCELIINSDHTYEIQLCFQATDDMVNCPVLSYGHYSTANNSLYLHDDFYDYDWELSIIENVVNVGGGYALLDGKAVLNYRNETVEVLPPNDDYLAKIKARIDTFITGQNDLPLVAGLYEDQNHDYSLRINDTGKYQLYLKDALLSDGDWSQKDNILILHDTHLNHDFQIAIGNGSLMSLGIPGEFGGTILTLIKTKESNQETKTSPKNRRGGCSRIK